MRTDDEVTNEAEPAREAAMQGGTEEQQDIPSRPFRAAARQVCFNSLVEEIYLDVSSSEEDDLGARVSITLTDEDALAQQRHRQEHRYGSSSLHMSDDTVDFDEYGTFGHGANLNDSVLNLRHSEVVDDTKSTETPVVRSIAAANVDNDCNPEPLPKRWSELYKPQPPHMQTQSPQPSKQPSSEDVFYPRDELPVRREPRDVNNYGHRHRHRSVLRIDERMERDVDKSGADHADKPNEADTAAHTAARRVGVGVGEAVFCGLMVAYVGVVRDACVWVVNMFSKHTASIEPMDDLAAAGAVVRESSQYFFGSKGGAAFVAIPNAQVQAMAVQASQSAAGSAASGVQGASSVAGSGVGASSSGMVDPTVPVVAGSTAVATAVAAMVAVLVSGEEVPLPPTSPLLTGCEIGGQPDVRNATIGLTFNGGEERRLTFVEANTLETAMVDAYNSFFNCDPDFQSRKTVNCSLPCDSQGCCNMTGPNLRHLYCRFTCEVHCDGCPEIEPLFYIDNSTSRNATRYVSTEAVDNVTNATTTGIAAREPFKQSTTTRSLEFQRTKGWQLPLLFTSTAHRWMQQQTQQGDPTCPPQCVVSRLVATMFCSLFDSDVPCGFVESVTYNTKGVAVSIFKDAEEVTTSTPSFHPSPRPSLRPVTSAPTTIPTTSPLAYIVETTRPPTWQPTRLPKSNAPVDVAVAVPPPPLSKAPISNAPESGAPIAATNTPTLSPTNAPSFAPTRAPTAPPTQSPTNAPTLAPTIEPTTVPTFAPTSNPTLDPSGPPTPTPTATPNSTPTGPPTSMPTATPTSTPTRTPTAAPTKMPATLSPNVNPTSVPSDLPTAIPSIFPSPLPSKAPSQFPSPLPSVEPNPLPMSGPSWAPSSPPTSRPSARLSPSPSHRPSALPTASPSLSPSASPKTRPSSVPSRLPSSGPSVLPSSIPSSGPSVSPSLTPSGGPSSRPSVPPTKLPTTSPSRSPSTSPNGLPSTLPSRLPSSGPSVIPSSIPSSGPSVSPSLTPTGGPSSQASVPPTKRPTTSPSWSPSASPNALPSTLPSRLPSFGPSLFPSAQPTLRPSIPPTIEPTSGPSSQPSLAPITLPTSSPSLTPSARPSTGPSLTLSNTPSALPTSTPSFGPSAGPSLPPSAQPSGGPSNMPSLLPSSMPSLQPSLAQSALPAARPSSTPSGRPSASPNSSPSFVPSFKPSLLPSTRPSLTPTRVPSTAPNAPPTALPSRSPSKGPSADPSSSPTTSPSLVPSSRPSAKPSLTPTSSPSLRPSASPSLLPSRNPSSRPSSSRSAAPSAQPAPLLILDVNFTASTLESDGFSYADSVFRNTSQPSYSSGSYQSIGDGEAVVKLGGVDNAVIDGMSGGYKSAFSIGSESLVTAEIIFKLDQVIGNDPGAFSEALCSMDSKLLGVAGNVDYLARLLGGGSGGPVQSTGFQTVTVSAGTLPLGSHNVAVGGYKSRKSFSNETTTIVIDRIRVYATKVSQRAFKLEVDGETRENMNETSYYLVPLLLVASFALVVSQRRKSSAGTAAAAASPPLNHANFCEDTPQESGQPLLPVDSPGNEDEMPYYVGNRIWL